MSRVVERVPREFGATSRDVVAMSSDPRRERGLCRSMKAFVPAVWLLGGAGRWRHATASLARGGECLLLAGVSPPPGDEEDH